MNRLLGAAIAALMMGTAANAATIFSDNFDTETLAVNAGLSNWTVTAGSIDVIGGGFFKFYGPDRYIDMNGSTGKAGTIVHDLGVLAAGAYSLTFDYGNNKNSNGIEQLSFGLVGGPNSFIDIVGAVASLTSYSFKFNFAGGAASLFFADSGNTPSDNGGPILDNVSLSAVPLPAGAPLLLAGLGALAFLRRKRKAL